MSDERAPTVEEQAKCTSATARYEPKDGGHWYCAKCGCEWVHRAAVAEALREVDAQIVKLANENGLATGHGDTIPDMVREMLSDAIETRDRKPADPVDWQERAELAEAWLALLEGDNLRRRG